MSAFTLAGLVVVSASASAEQSLATKYGVRTVASGSFSAPSSPSINDSGTVAYNEGGLRIYSETGGNGLRIVAKVGDPAPGFPGANYSNLPSAHGSVRVGNADVVAYLGQPTSVADGPSIWTQQGTAAPVLLFGQGKPATGLSGITFSGAASPFSMSDQGQVAVLGAVKGLSLGTISSQGIWAQKTVGGSLDLVAGPSQVAPGIANGTFKGTFSYPVINNDGNVAFAGDVITPSAKVSGLYSNVGGSLTLKAVTGGQLPGLSSSIQLKSIESYMIDLTEFGKIGFEGELSGPGINPSRDNAYLIETDTGFRIALQEGQTRPGFSGETLFDMYDSQLNSKAQVTALVSLSNIGDALVTEVGSGTFRIVAENGGQIPDQFPGVHFFNLGPNSTFDINSHNVIVFTSLIAGTGSGSDPNDFDFGIFAEIAPGVVKTVVRDGDTIQVAPNIFKTIDQIAQPTSADKFLNNNNQLTFAVRFTDYSTGVFVVAVPEAGTTTLLSIAAVAIVVCAVVKRINRRTPS